MKFIYRKFEIIILYFIGISCFGQNEHFKFNFDDCTFQDATNKLLHYVKPGGNPDCVCGLGTKAMSLNGAEDFLKFSNSINHLFDKDFTFDFYFTIENKNGEADIFSLRNGCSNLDSLMALRYLCDTDEILFEIGSHVSNYHSVKVSVSTDLCWHRFTLVKFGLTYLVYLDNKLINSILSKENIIFSRQALMAFGDNPCNLVNQIQKLRGTVDEIVMYDRALSDIELQKKHIHPDQIKTQNTTIFKGDNIQLEVGQSCSNKIDWSPKTSLDAFDELDPFATPSQTTTYTVTLDNGVCISKDSVTIFVAEKDKLDCNKLLLPKAFTPNSDGLNEEYGISNIFLVEELKSFEVFDRWGAKVWETSQKGDQWDGTSNGQLLLNGMYMYKIKYTCNAAEHLNIDNFYLLR